MAEEMVGESVNCDRQPVRPEWKTTTAYDRKFRYKTSVIPFLMTFLPVSIIPCYQGCLERTHRLPFPATVFQVYNILKLFPRY